MVQSFKPSRFTTFKSGPVTADPHKFYLTQRTRFPVHLIQQYISEAEKQDKRSPVSKNSAVYWDIVEEVSSGLQTRRENLKMKYSNIVETTMVDNYNVEVFEDLNKQQKLTKWDNFEDHCLDSNSCSDETCYLYEDEKWDRFENHHNDSNSDSDWI